MPSTQFESVAFFESKLTSTTPSSDADSTTQHPTRRHEVASVLEENVDTEPLESFEQLRQIVDALDDVVALANHDLTRLYFVNEAYEKIWSRPCEELLADPLSFLDGIHPDDRDRVHDAIFNAPRGSFDVEFRVMRAGGGQRWVWSRGFPVRDASGDVYRIATISEDITERKAVAESHDRLLRGFTHDVKNPLGAADGYLALLEMGVSGELTAMQTDHVGRARRAIRAALDLVMHLLEIERAKAGELILASERVDLGKLVGDAVEDFRVAAHNKNLTLIFVVERTDDDLIMETDRARVRQIFANLLSNAVKYTPSDGRIVVSARDGGAGGEEPPGAGRWVVLSVADNGPGIPAEKQNLMFREFTRFSSDTTEGSGIGLAISQHLAHALGGQITFRSIEGVGSTFSLWLPRRCH